MRILVAIYIILLTTQVSMAQRHVRDQMRIGESGADSTSLYQFSIPENEDYDYFVGALGVVSNLPSGVMDNDYFYIRNDSIFTKYSFDYEGFTPNPLNLIVSNATGIDTIVVNITDVTGAWDNNDYASPTIAAKYPGINKGDYILWNYTSGQDLQVTIPALSSGNKVVIQGKKYNSIELNIQAAAGSGPGNRVIITNFLGQVETQNGIELKNPDFIRITGQYDTTMGTGHRYFPGCDKDGSTVSFGFSHGTFGIFQNNGWQSETSGTGLLINTDNTGVEIDHLEIANGGFHGIRIGWNDNYSVADYTHIHHNFIHDVGSQAIILGVISGFPQQVFKNAVIENNAIVRSGGECIQTSWISSGSMIRNNFLHGALDWKSPFSRWQDGIIEFSSIGGDIDINSNIIMGGGYNVMNLTTRDNNSTPLVYPSDTVHFRNNLVYRNRSNVGIFTHSESDNLTHISFDGNYFGKQGYDLDEVYNSGDTTNNKAMGLHNKDVDILVKNNTYDNSIEVLTAGQASPIKSNNKKLPIAVPEFENYFGLPAQFNYLKINRYTGIIGTDPNFSSTGTKKGNPASWEVGDIVQTWNSDGETRFYKCLQATSNASDAPPTDNTSSATWQLMTWVKPDGSISHFPADDVRIKPTNYYFALRGMGLSDSISANPPTVPPPVPNVPPVVSVDQPLDQEKYNINDTVPVLVSATDPDGAIVQVKIILNGQLLKNEYQAPYTADFYPNTIGTNEVFAIAYDSDGDSTISDTVSISVLNPNFFKVLHFAKVTGTDHNTAAASKSMLEAIGTQVGFTVDHDTTGANFNTLAQLQQYEVVVFSNTTGNNLLSSAQRANFENYMQNGGAMVGIHAAADAHRHAKADGTGTGTWDWYAELLGASVQSSPSETGSSTAGTIDHVNSHPAVDILSDPVSFVSAFPYWEGGFFDSSVVPVMKIRSTGSQSYDAARYLAWYRYLPGGGKMFYTGLGHSAGEFLNNTDFRVHIREAILWAQRNANPVVSLKPNMTPYEIMLSESQERMLMVLKPGREEEAREIFKKWGLDFAVIGHLTDTGRLVVKMNGETFADLKVQDIVDNSPEYDRPWKEVEPRPEITADDLKNDQDPITSLKQMMNTANLASKRWIYEQYDHMVMGDTVQYPGGDAGVVRVHGTKKALAITTDCSPRYCLAAPKEGGKQAVAEAWRNLVAVGAKPLAVTNNLNFGNPEKEEIMGQFVGCITGMREACESLEFPVISGNVSLYNETEGKAIMPTPVIGGVGLMRDVSTMMTMNFKSEGEDVYLIGGDDTDAPWVGSSLYLKEIEGVEDGMPPVVDLAGERKTGEFVLDLNAKELLTACHDVSAGGILVAAAEMAIKGQIGVQLDNLDVANAWWFGENQGRYVVTTKDGATLEQLASASGISMKKLGKTGGQEISIGDSLSVSLNELADIHNNWFDAYMSKAA